MEIVPYSSVEHAEAVRRLNDKLAAGGSAFLFPVEPPTPRDPSSSVYYEHFVAIEDGEVFGGYLLKHQTFLIGGRPVALDNLQLPLSLGLIDPRHANVSVALLFDALGRNDLLYCLGMGSQESKLVKLLTAAGWQHRVVPFLFRILSGNRFARNIRLPANRARLQFLLRVAGSIGIAGLGLWALHRSRGSQAKKLLDVREVLRFDQFADDLAAHHGGNYSLLGDRGAGTLNGWYPETNPTFHRLVVREAGQVIGWAVLLDTQMRGHKYFGDLRVGTLADCFSAPGKETAVVAAADRFLTQRGVDLIVSNQLHPAWIDALENAGFRTGPSNFFFYFSRDLADQLESVPNWDQRMHLNRGDGDGPIHL